MVGRKLSDFEKGLIAVIFTGILGWVGTQLLEVSTTKQTAEDNRDSINELINLHLQK